MPTDFTLPELGENISSGDVLRILVKPGDSLAKDQPVLEIETDKATIEVPASVSGIVKDIKVKPGDKVAVGQAILSVESEDAPAPKAAAAKPAPKAEAAQNVDSGSKAAPAAKAEAPPKAEPAPKAASASKPEARATSAPAEPPDPDALPDTDASADDDAGGPVTSGEGAEGGARGRNVVDISRGARTTPESPAAPDHPPAPAAPSVRRMARELGVDINDVSGSGSDGRISVDDVKAHVNRIVSRPAAAGAAPVEALPDFSRWGEVERQPLRGVRRKTAQHLASAWASIPHVTQHDAADITALEELRKRYAKSVEAAGGNLTVTSILVKIVAAALRKFPQFNASIDMASEEIVYKKYVHIGIAVDTDRGLLVPVIRDADSKNVTQLSIELSQLSEKARGRKLAVEDMQGGCFSLSNLGGIGGTSFTPIVNAPEVAILGVSRARVEPVYRDNQFVPRLMLPLSLSYDHRVVDGADGIRFLRWVIEALEQPFLLAL